MGALNILFFVISGAELQVLIQPVTLTVGVIYIIARSCGKYYGAMFSCALTAATLPDGALARKVVLFAVLIYELAGSALTKRSLLAVGEIKQEGRISARKVNEEK